MTRAMTSWGRKTRQSRLRAVTKTTMLTIQKTMPWSVSPAPLRRRGPADAQKAAETAALPKAKRGTKVISLKLFHLPTYNWTVILIHPRQMCSDVIFVWVHGVGDYWLLTQNSGIQKALHWFSSKQIIHLIINKINHEVLWLFRLRVLATNLLHHHWAQ